jgi:hypothetical protein
MKTYKLRYDKRTGDARFTYRTIDDETGERMEHELGGIFRSKSEAQEWFESYMATSKSYMTPCGEPLPFTKPPLTFDPTQRVWVVVQ